MDTISRDNNSMLPIAGIILGGIGLVLGGIALAQVSKVKQSVADHQTKIDLIDGIKNTADQAAVSADNALKGNKALGDQTQKAFDTVGPALTSLREDVSKIQESLKKPAPAPATPGKPGKKGASGEPATAGPGEYVVKAGDTSGTKIAKNLGCSIKALEDVNPGVNWSHLSVGQKLKVPTK
jgi:LysM domain-containing protein